MDDVQVLVHILMFLILGTRDFVNPFATQVGLNEPEKDNADQTATGKDKKVKITLVSVTGYRWSHN